MGHHGGAGVMKHFAATCMIPVVVAVQEIPNGFVRDRLDGSYHFLGMVGVYRFNGDDSFVRHHEHREIGIRGVPETVHSLVYLGGMRG